MRARRSASFTMRSAERSRHGRVVLGDERLGEHLERADRRLELVAHVGDEVAAHALDPMDLRDVVDERRGTERSLVVRSSGPPAGGRTARGGPNSCSSRSRRARRQRARRATRRWHRRRPRRRASRRGSARPRRCGTPRRRRRRATTTPWRRLVECGEQAGRAARLRRLLRALGPRLLRARSCSSVAAGSRTSAEPPGDVALGAGIARSGEELLGDVELDEPADSRGPRRRPRR